MYCRARSPNISSCVLLHWLVDPKPANLSLETSRSASRAFHMPPALPPCYRPHHLRLPLRSHTTYPTPTPTPSPPPPPQSRSPIPPTTFPFPPPPQVLSPCRCPPHCPLHHTHSPHAPHHPPPPFPPSTPSAPHSSPCHTLLPLPHHINPPPSTEFQQNPTKSLIR